MAIETEVKVVLDDRVAFRRKLAHLRPTAASDRHFEDNLVLDFPDGRLRARRCLLRVRKCEAGAFITFKGPAISRSLFKSREELETRVEDGTAILQILDMLGFSVWFRYQKYREEFRLKMGDGPQAELHLAIDETPIGDYIELEGSEAAIRKAAAELKIDENRFLRDSYYSLYIDFCRRRGIEPAHMIFGMD